MQLVRWLVSSGRISDPPTLSSVREYASGPAGRTAAAAPSAPRRIEPGELKHLHRIGVTVSATVDEVMRRRIDEAAGRRGVTRSVWIAEAIVEKLEREG